MKKNHFDPNTSFIDLPILRKTIYFSLTAAGIISGVIFYFSELTPNLSFEGFNQAITVFKAPLGILGVTIPFIALLAANHRSEQTKEQMRLASENNNFSNYFKHADEFEQFVEKHHKKESIEIISARSFHKLSFPEARNGNYIAAKEITLRTKNTISLAAKGVKEINEHRKTLNSLESSHGIVMSPNIGLRDKLRDTANRIEEDFKKSRGYRADNPDYKPDPSLTGRDLGRELQNANDELERHREVIAKLESEQNFETLPVREFITNKIYELNREINSFGTYLGLSKKTEGSSPTDSALISEKNTSDIALLTTLRDAAKIAKLPLEFGDNSGSDDLIDNYINIVKKSNLIVIQHTGKNQASISPI
ncbi:hypothetical protein [Pseudomonas sp. OHS18]|uniref:hypothetical protein n=1 Tax=Pseudomonas sp. OHS18 TaxID=3399679 RepID=UPI003A88A7A4